MIAGAPRDGAIEQRRALRVGSSAFQRAAESDRGLVPHQPFEVAEDERSALALRESGEFLVEYGARLAQGQIAEGSPPSILPELGSSADTFLAISPNGAGIMHRRPPPRQ
jgi:hypothetical protein